MSGFGSLLRHVGMKSDRNASSESEESPVCRHDVCGTFQHIRPLYYCNLYSTPQ